MVRTTISLQRDASCKEMKVVLTGTTYHNDWNGAETARSQLSGLQREHKTDKNEDIISNPR